MNASLALRAWTGVASKPEAPARQDTQPRWRFGLGRRRPKIRVGGRRKKIPEAGMSQGGSGPCTTSGKVAGGAPSRVRSAATLSPGRSRGRCNSRQMRQSDVITPAPRRGQSHWPRASGRATGAHPAPVAATNLPRPSFLRVSADRPGSLKKGGGHVPSATAISYERCERGVKRENRKSRGKLTPFHPPRDPPGRRRRNRTPSPTASPRPPGSPAPPCSRRSVGRCSRPSG